MKKVIFYLMIYLFFGCNDSTEKTSIEKVHIPESFEGIVYEVEEIGFPYLNIRVMRIKDLKTKNSLKGFSSDYPYFKFISKDKIEMLSARAYNVQVGDIVKYNSHRRRLEYYRDGKKHNESVVTSHKYALEFYKNKQVKGR